MRLAVFATDPMWWDGTCYTAIAPFLRYALSFESCVDELILFAPLQRSTVERGSFSVAIGPRTRVVGLPFFRSSADMYRSLWRTAPSLVRTVLRERRSWDVGWVVASHVPDLICAWLLSKMGKRCFLYVRGNVVKDVESHMLRGAKGRAARLLATMTRRAVSSAIRRGTPACVVGAELYAMYGSDSHQVYCVHESIVEAADILPAPRASRGGRAEYTAIYVGRLAPEKGLEVLIGAVAIVRDKGLNLRCRIVGSGKSEGGLRNIVARAGLEQVVEFVGFVEPGPELYREYDGADLFVSTSHTEGIPKTLYEAMARGLPIVATDVGGVAQLVTNRVNGLLVQPRDCAAAASAIEELMRSPGLMELFGRANWEKVRGYTLRATRDNLHEIITTRMWPSS